MLRSKKPFAARFWEKVDKSGGPDACWLWTGDISTSGYGRFGIWDAVANKGHMEYAHRVAYELTYGLIHNGFLICHHCDVKLCCNPTHYFAGTTRDNMQDAARKGRTCSGERHRSHTNPGTVLKGEQIGNSKLTSDEVREIRLASLNGVLGSVLAAQFGISPSMITMIISRKRWKHVSSRTEPLR